MKRKRVERMYGVFDLECDKMKLVSQMSLMKCVVDEIDETRTRIESVYIWLIEGVFDPDDRKTKRLYEAIREYGIEKTHVRIVPIQKALQEFCSLIAKNRYIPVVAHAYDRDVEALMQTDLDLNGGFFKPDGTAKSKVWPKIDHVCSQILLKDMCPNYWVSIRSKITDGFRGCKLEHHLKLNFDRAQKHTSLDDCMDLFDLLCILFKTDGAKTRTRLFKNVKGIPYI